MRNGKRGWCFILSAGIAWIVSGGGCRSTSDHSYRFPDHNNRSLDRILVEAIRYAGQVSDSDEKSKILYSIAWLQARAGQVEDAQRTVEQIGSTYWQDAGLKVVAETLLESRRVRDSLQLAQRITCNAMKSELTRAIAVLSFELGKEEEFLEAVGQISDERVRACTLAKVAKISAERGNLNRAKKTFADALGRALSIENEWRRYEAIESIAYFQVKSNLVQDAVHTIQYITNPHDRSLITAGISAMLREQGDPEYSSVLMHTALSDALRVTDSDQREKILCSIGNLCASCGMKKDAQKIVDLIKGSSQRLSPQSLYTMANILLKAGQTEQAHQLSAQISDYEIRSRALSEVAIAYARAKDYGRALQIAKVCSKEDAERVFFHVAEAQVKSNLLADALKTLELIKDAGRQVRILNAIASKTGDRDAWHKATRIALGVKHDMVLTYGRIMLRPPESFEEMVEHNLAVRGWAGCSDMLYSISMSLLNAELYDHALSVAHKIPNRLAQSWVMHEIAALQAKAGKTSEALWTAKQVKDNMARVWALVRIANHFSDNGRAELAYQVLYDAFKESKTIRNPRARKIVMFEVATALAKSGKELDVLNWVETLSLPEEKLVLLIGVAYGLIRAASPEALNSEKLRTEETCPRILRRGVLEPVGETPEIPFETEKRMLTLLLQRLAKW